MMPEFNLKHWRSSDMGYTTDFTGKFLLNKKLMPTHMAYLNKFAETRRMERNAAIADKLEDPLRKAVGLPIGMDGEFFVNAGGFCGQDNDESVTDHNCAPSTQPGLWCQWVPNEDGTAIVWDEGEKFYSYTEWLVYIIRNFLSPWGYVINGIVEYQGEDPSDFGKIIVTNNVVVVKEGKRSYGDEE